MLKIDLSTGQLFEFKEDNFSFNIVEENTTLVIPMNQQMVVVGEMMIDGDLYIDGEIAFL